MNSGDRHFVSQLVLIDNNWKNIRIVGLDVVCSWWENGAIEVAANWWPIDGCGHGFKWDGIGIFRWGSREVSVEMRSWR